MACGKRSYNLKGNIKAGEAYGYVEYSVGSYVLEKIPLVSDRTLKNAPAIFRWSDGLIGLLMKYKAN